MVTRNSALLPASRTAPSSTGVPIPYDEIDRYVEAQMRRLKMPGVALAVVERDQIVYQRGYGSARPGGGAPTPQTPFVLGSTTKSFTALAVMQLVEAGKVRLDDPVQGYLPWFRVADPSASEQITVRHLLNQTSGLPMLPGMKLLADMDDSPGAAERQARSLSTLELNRPVGSAFEYSNLNFNLLGLIIEAVSGESYEDYVQNCIFNPLDMLHSYTSLDAAKLDGLAQGYRYWFAQPVVAPDLAIPRGSIASGQLISTSEDMAHYLIAHLNEGSYRDGRVLSNAGMDELHRGIAEQWFLGDLVGAYAMGWFASEIAGAKVLWHGGNVPDFSSYMAILPEQGRGVVMLVNADHYGLPMVLPEVGAGLAALLAGQQPPAIGLGFLPWVMRSLALIPVAQVAGVILTLATLARWRRDPAARPPRGQLWGQHVLPALIPNLSLAALPLVIRSKGLDGYLPLFNPDVSWTARFCGGFAAAWTVLRTALVLLAGSKPRG